MPTRRINQRGKETISECLLTKKQRVALNMIQEGIPSKVISTVASIPENWVTQLEGLFGTELYKNIVRRGEASEKTMIAIKMIRDKIDVGIIKTVAALPEKDVIELKKRMEKTTIEKSLSNGGDISKLDGKSLFFCGCSVSGTSSTLHFQANCLEYFFSSC